MIKLSLFEWGVWQQGKPFIFQITVGAGGSFTLPLTNVVPGHNFKVFWGDGTSNEITAYNDLDKVHTYTDAGSYSIRIQGTCSGFQFNNIGSKLLITKVISWGSVGFKRLNFFGCSNLTYLPSESRKLNSVTNFDDGFRNTGITSIPAGIFDNNIVATTFAQCFYGCTGLTSIPTDLFKDNIAVTSFSYCFYGCTNLVSLPTDIFRYNTNVLSFIYTFYNCDTLTTLPVDIFRYNVNVTGFTNCFYHCSGLTTLPADIFKFNVSVTTFAATFSTCAVLATVSTDLFRFNTLCLSFNSTFINCPKMQQHATIFYGAGEQATRFLNQSVNFGDCFNRTTFTGTQGVAPDLWNCNFGTGTPAKSSCWAGAGNSLTSLSNYVDIPAAWK